MNQVVVFYNPFLPELKISVNGKKLSPYSSLMSFQHQRLEKWSDCLFAELYREVNSDYEMLCVSNEFTCEWLEELAHRNSHCISFVSQALPMDANVYERLDKLEILGGEEAGKSIIIPVINVRNNDEMTIAVYEVLEEQGIFEDVSDDGITWTDCPLTTVEIKTFDANDELPYDAPVVIALCESEDDYIRLDADAPIYALVMGTETRFIKRQGTKLYFSVDPDDIGMMAAECMAHSKSSSGVANLNSKADWSDCFDRIDATVAKYNEDHPDSPISFDRTQFESNDEKWGQLATSTLSLRVGDVSRDSGPEAISQSGEKVYVDRDTLNDVGGSVKEELNGADITRGENHETIESTKSRQVHTGEQNITKNYTTCDINGNINHEITVNDGNSAPKCTQDAIGDHLGEFASAKGGKFNVEVKFDSPCSPESKASYEDFRKQIEGDSKYDNISITYPWDKEE